MTFPNMISKDSGNWQERFCKCNDKNVWNKIVKSLLTKGPNDDDVDDDDDDASSGLSLRAGGRGFSPATKRVASGYFYRKIERK